MLDAEILGLSKYFLIFLLISCDLDMQLTVATHTTYEGAI